MGIKSHTISIKMVNKPGVLARVAQIFSRRGWNLDSLVVSSCMDSEYSRMTVTAQGLSENLEQIVQQVSKLVDVVHCTDHSNDISVVKELALIKIRCSVEERIELLQIVEHFDCKTIDFTATSMIIQASGNSDKLDAMIKLVEKFDIVELVRTGKVLMARGEQET